MAKVRGWPTVSCEKESGERCQLDEDEEEEEEEEEIEVDDRWWYRFQGKT